MHKTAEYGVAALVVVAVAVVAKLLLGRWVSAQGRACNFTETSVLYGGERFSREKHLALAKKHGFTNIMYAEDMKEAVQVCASYANAGDYVLLSPACASWGMFKDFEERGRIFKDCVRSL